MNTKDFLRLGVPLGETTRRATDFVAKSCDGFSMLSQHRVEAASRRRASETCEFAPFSQI